jgi:hypothetical protein
MSVKDQLSPYLNRFVLLCQQKSNVKLELCCDNGQVSVNLSHTLGVVSSTSPNEFPKKEKYSEVLKKKNIGTSQLNRLQRRAFERAEEAKKEAKLQQETAKQAKMEAVKARSEAEKVKLKAEDVNTDIEDTNTNNSELVFMRSKYEHLLNEYTKIFVPSYDRKADVHNKASESGSKCIKCNHCDLTFEMDSYLKVHIDLIHKSEGACQDQLKCSHCHLKFNDLQVLEKHVKREHRFKCKSCPQTFKEKLALNMHFNSSHKEVGTRK